MKNLFENSTRLNEDECDIESRENNNTDICQYRMFNMYQTNKDTEKECKINYDKIMDFSVNNRMNIRDGIGFTNACRVDDDSVVRNEFEMYDKGRQQLFSRVFQGGPNVNKGGLEPEIENDPSMARIFLIDWIWEADGNSLPRTTMDLDDAT